MKTRHLLKAVTIIVFVLMVFSPAQDAHSSGFAVYTQGASSLGQGNSVTAHLESPSAIFINPALINRLEGTKLEVGTTALWPSRDFKSDTGATFQSESNTFFPSTIYLTHKYNDKLSFGLGIFSPFGLGSEWHDTWEGRYITTSSEITTFNFNPVVSYQALPNLSIAVGFNIITLDATLEQKINLKTLQPGLNDGNRKFEGDGNGIGYNVGLLYDLNSDISIGASFRGEVEIDAEGRADFDIPANALPMVHALFPDTPASTTLTLPEQFHAGIAYKGFDRLTMEAGIRWEGWSSFSQIFKLDETVAGSKLSTKPRNWSDGLSVLFGGEYQLNDKVALRAGYIKSDTVVPDDTFEPGIPDADTDILSVGTGIKIKKCTLDLAYAYQKTHTRHKSNSIDDNAATPLNAALSANGRYGTEIHILGVSLTHTF